MKNLKKIFMIIVLVTVFMCVSINVVNAAESGDPFASIDDETNSSGDDFDQDDDTDFPALTVSPANTNSSNTNSINITGINNTNSNTSNNNTANTNSNTNKVNTLAKTGAADNTGIMALVVVVCGISAVYSFKKVNDYKKL